jgi:hypothetical protein
MHLCNNIERKWNFLELFLLKEYIKLSFSMFRKYLLIIILVFFGVKGFASDSDSSKSGFNVSEYQAEVRKIKVEAEEIYQHFQIYELDIVEEEYQKLFSDVEKVEQILKELNVSDDTKIKNEFYDIFEETLDSYSILINIYDFYVQLERKKDRWSNQYFNLWEQTYAYKTRIDQLYVKEEKINVHYGGMKDAKVTKVRKKNIYESCSAIYDKKMAQLKRLNDCDHYGRIELLEELIPVLRRCSKLVLVDGTKTLEKELKRTDDPQKMASLILDYKID